jgi:hypothetical protein
LVALAGIVSLLIIGLNGWLLASVLFGHASQ